MTCRKIFWYTITVFLSLAALTLSFPGGMLCLTGQSAASSDDVVVATINDNIRINKSQLEQTVAAYKKKRGTKQVFSLDKA